MKYKDFCCRDLVKLLNDPESDITYYNVLRIFLFNDSQIDFCPMCGTQLPPELDDFYDEVMAKEFGITRSNYSEMADQGRIPQEFESDAWWKKRQHYSNFPTTHQAPAEGQAANSKAYEAWKANILQPTDVFCCIGLWMRVFTHPRNYDDEPLFKARSLIAYEPEKRRFLLKNMETLDEIQFRKDQPKNLLRYPCFYCVACGKALPKNLAPEWFSMITKQFDVQDLSNSKEIAQKVTPTYLTDAWWRQKKI